MPRRSAILSFAPLRLIRYRQLQKTLSFAIIIHEKKKNVNSFIKICVALTKKIS